MDLNGKTAVITGGASGIGLSMAKLFSSKGATVVIADLPQAPIDDAVKSLSGKGIAAPCDVTNEEQTEAVMKKAVEETGRLDIAVLNAGILRDGLLIKVDKDTGKVKDKMSLKNWQMVIDVNLTGVFISGREAAAKMIDCGNGGLMILMSSIARHGNMGQTNYSAAKAGVASLTVAWSKELARYKIRVAALAPGFIATPMVMKDMKQEALDKWKKTIPVGRLGEPEEIAHSALYLAENDLVTGVVLEISGGIRI